jgi:stress response protein YsnF
MVVTVEIDDDSQISRATEILEDCGALDVDERVEHWKAAGYTGYDEQAKPLTREEIARERESLQVIQEELKVGKRAVQRGVVRVHRRITETPVQEQVTLNEERAVVERRPVDRPATAADLAAFKEGEMEIRETTEEPGLSTTARVVEEVSIV